jgi:hypothetical protein
LSCHPAWNTARSRQRRHVLLLAPACWTQRAPNIMRETNHQPYFLSTFY